MPDTLPMIREVHGWLESSIRNAPFSVRESYRWAKWATYVKTYAGDYINTPVDIWCVASNFARRERISESIGPFSGEGFDDLDSWLTQRPWEKGREQSYLDMIEQGVIKPLRDTQDARVSIGPTPVDTEGITTLRAIGKEWVANILMTLWKERPYLLPSQQIALFIEQCKQNGIEASTLAFRIGKATFKVNLT